MADKIKLIIALALAVAALAGFYIFEEQQQVVRVLGLLVGFGVAAFIASRSEVGRHAVAFSRGAVIEIRKVVWPTRKETINTTLLVMAMVVLVGIILWVFDMFLSWGIQLLTGQGS
ncbi:MAG: preprotein translocase subunit SecE [Pseudomonadota bacterium]